MVAKVLLMLGLELAVLPFAYGVWLDFCTLPVVAGSVATRLAFLRAAPVGFAALHWLLGMAWIIGIAAFLNVIRSVLKPGVSVGWSHVVQTCQHQMLCNSSDHEHC